MRNDEKIMHLANFNITFGKDQDPMLEYFFDIIYPSFTADFKRGVPNKRPQYYFSNIELKEIDGSYVLVGNYIKDSEFDIHTTIANGELVSTPSIIPTAPYSRFIIFLNNHKMVLIRNESRSPDIRSFQSTYKSAINKYISQYNRKHKKTTLPQAFVNIVDMPLEKDIDAALKDILNFEWLKLRFFPLNNDINPIFIADSISDEMRKIQSERAHIQFNRPKSKSEIKNIITKSSGLAVVTIKGTDNNGNETQIKEDKFKSNIGISLHGDIKPENDDFFASHAKKNNIIKDVSEENSKLYNDNKGNLLNFAERLSLKNESEGETSQDDVSQRMLGTDLDE